MEADRPDREVSKDHRRVIRHLIDNEGWAYRNSGKGYPKLYPPGSSQFITVPKTGHSKGHAFENWLHAIRRAGGHWPPVTLAEQDEEEEGEE